MVSVSPDDFVAALKTTVFDAAVADVATDLRDGPPGRNPGGRSVALHEWFVRLPSHDQTLVLEIARDAAHAALFGALSVLDGVRAIGDPPHAQLHLLSVDAEGSESRLTHEGEGLHDRLNRLVHPPSEVWPTA